MCNLEWGLDAYFLHITWKIMPVLWIQRNINVVKKQKWRRNIITINYSNTAVLSSNKSFQCLLQHDSDWLEYVEMVLYHWMTAQDWGEVARQNSNQPEEKEGVLGLCEKSLIFCSHPTFKTINDRHLGGPNLGTMKLSQVLLFDCRDTLDKAERTKLCTWLILSNTANTFSKYS